MQLPKKLPPDYVPISIASLPIIGYLEQTVADAITEAVTAVSKAKPKYPYKSLKESASEFIALYLKGIYL